jgi:hypothetical protein
MEKLNIESSPHLIEHSLITKAVRRGNVDLVEKVFKYLINIEGQLNWLKDRLAVIGYEECWPYANRLNFNCNDYQLLEQYKAIACKVKNKDCDGLAYLAKRLNQWNKNAVIGTEEQQLAIRKIAEAIKDDTQFWSWIESQPAYDENRQRIEAAKSARNKNLMRKDKSIMLAAAYFSVTSPIPDVETIEPNNDPDFEYWVAIDKHTAEGEDIIGRAAEQINLPKHDGYLLAFFFAGAICNKNQDAPFFELFKKYRFGLMGFSKEQAKEKWEELKPLIIDMTKLEVELLLKRITNINDKSDELTLF